MNILEYLHHSEEIKVFEYPDFIRWVSQLAARGETSGPNQSEALISFTRLNLKRMQRIDKTFKLNDELTAILKSDLPRQHWLVITEAWCGDCAQIALALISARDVRNPMSKT